MYRLLNNYYNYAFYKIRTNQIAGTMSHDQSLYHICNNDWSQLVITLSCVYTVYIYTCTCLQNYYYNNYVLLPTHLLWKE